MMDNLSCPKCRSNLYSQTPYGFACSACRYEERIDRWAYTSPGPTAYVPTRQNRLREWRETYDWKQTKRAWQQIKPAARRNKAPPTRFGKLSKLPPVSEIKTQLELNQAYLRAHKHLAVYRETGCKDDLVAACRSLNLCLQHMQLAKNGGLIEALRQDITTMIRQSIVSK